MSLKAVPSMRELVAAAHRHALREAAARDRVRRLGEAAERAHDRATLEVGDEGDERERGEQAEQQAVPRRSSSRRRSATAG